MKIIVSIMLLFSANLALSQDLAEEVFVRQTIEDFFSAFHKQDSIALRNLVHSSVTIQSISTSADGETKISTESYDNFLKSILSIPETTKFEEKLHSFDIRINGALANVIMPYSFFVNGNLSHCGVNSFQLFKENGEWKIIYIVDTRIKEGLIDSRCEI